MSNRLPLFALALAAGGCELPARLMGEPVVIEVAATYDGASAQVTAETVAAPIEQQVTGADGMTRIESTSRNDGTYLARVTFAPGTDADLAQVLVQNRVALALPQLPELVRRAQVKVTPGKPDPAAKAVAIVLLDKGEMGRKALREWVEVAAKRIEKDGAGKPEVFPGPDEPGIHIHIDREKCDAAGIKLADIRDVLQAAGDKATKAGEKMTPDGYAKLTVPSSTGNQVPITGLVALKEVAGPAAVYRVNMVRAVRLTAAVPEGTSAADAAAKWVELAKPPKGFAVETLTGK